MDYVIASVVSYLLGSIPFGYVLTHVAGMGDIRSIGSGNIGATNVLRTGNKKLAALTLFLDGIKGTIAVLIAHFCYPELDAIAALFALLGHLFPIWLKGKGGKGVATTVGVLVALCWPAGIATILVWILVAKLSRYSSLAALVATGVSPLSVFVFGRGDVVWLTGVIILLVYWKHSANIERLIKGTEPKIAQSNKPDALSL